MHHELSDRLLERYCAGDCSPSERAEVEAWTAVDPARGEMLRVLAAAWRATGAVPTERPDVPAAWAEIQARIGRAGRPLRLVPLAEPRRARWRRVLWPAAGIAAALTLAVGGTMLSKRAAGNNAAAASSIDRPLREIVTRRGQRAALNLPDGSRVVLGAESRLAVPRTYRPGTGPRDVFLKGEAYFEVTHNRSRPFRVHAANGVAEDLGTEFVVRAYPETKGMEVVVAHGAVALSAADNGHVRGRPLLTLLPGEYGRLDSSGTATLTPGIALAPYTAWVAGDLVFDNTQMRDAIRRLERWYDIDIRLADGALADRRITVAFQERTAAAAALDHVALSLGAHVEWNGRVAVLRGGAR